MKFIYDDNIGYVSLLQHMGVDKVVADAARVSFMSDTPELEELSPRDKKLIGYLAEHRHTSPFEHCTMSFKIKVPMYVAKQHMRHRTWSYNEVSRRYTSESIEFYNPKVFREQHKNNRQASVEKENFDPEINAIHGATMIWPLMASEAIASHSKASLKLYHDLLKAGVAREQARSVLPQSLYTEYWATANLLNVIKFLKLRLAEEAQWEIRVMAQAMAEYVQEKFPETYAVCKEHSFI